MAIPVQAPRTIASEARHRAACIPAMRDLAQRMGLPPDSAEDLQDMMDDFSQRALADDLEQDARMRGWRA